MNIGDIHDRWATRTGAYSPAYYAYYGPNGTSDVIRTSLDRVVDHDADILELGCSSGRHLAHLYEHGYENLHGVDINDAAFDVMERTYPDLSSAGTFYRSPLETVVRNADDDHFDVVYSVETLQHLHPDAEWVFDELIRLTERLILIAETDVDGSDDCEEDTEADTDNTTWSTERVAFGPESATSDVRYVDGVPLYVRDWTQIFTEHGWVEAESTSLKRYTVKAFRPPLV